MPLCTCFFAIPLCDGRSACSVYVAMCNRMLDVDKRQKNKVCYIFFKNSFPIVKLLNIYCYFKSTRHSICLRQCFFAGEQLGLSEQGQQGDSYEFNFINIGDGATSLGARGSTSAVVSIENTLDV